MKRQQTVIAAIAIVLGIGSSAAQATYTERGRQIPAETSPRSIAQPEIEPEKDADKAAAAAPDGAPVQAESASSDRKIEKEIEALLREDSDLDEGAVQVRVRDGVVELAGKLQSDAQKERAIRTAWATGAMTVDARALSVEEAHREQR